MEVPVGSDPMILNLQCRRGGSFSRHTHPIKAGWQKVSVLLIIAWPAMEMKFFTKEIVGEVSVSVGQLEEPDYIRRNWIIWKLVLLLMRGRAVDLRELFYRNIDV